MAIQTTMKKVLLAAQIFGIMPVAGILQQNTSNLKFSWISWRMLYSILTLIGMTFMIVFQLKRNIEEENDMVEIYRDVSYIAAICTCIFFIELAKEWPNFVKNWTAVERSMSKYGFPIGLDRKVNGMLVVFLTFCLLRYILTQLHQLVKTAQCRNMLDDDAFTLFLKAKFINICSVFQCNSLAGLLLMYVNIQIIFSHTFVDVFIMTISISLAARLNQVTKRIKYAVMIGVKSEEIWIEIREDYDRLENLCKYINLHMSNFIVLSFVRNLSMVLIQLFNSLKIRTSFTETLYFYYAFGFLVVRTAFVCIVGSAVNDESRKPLVYLFKIPDNVYNIEIERLIRQVSVSDMALSGMNFFKIRRDIVLKIAGALVTYELILIQFAGDALKLHANSTSCSI